MVDLFHDIALDAADRSPQSVALQRRDASLTYCEVARAIAGFAALLRDLGVRRGDRVAVYLPKTFDSVVSLFAITAAGAVAVPINPALKPAQVGHILSDCEPRVLFTSPSRLRGLATAITGSRASMTVVFDEVPPTNATAEPFKVAHWCIDTGATSSVFDTVSAIDHDLAAILYTSGSTGLAKGVMLSHRNLVAGAASVAGYLDNVAEDRILAVLPLSFDYGLNQVLSAFRVGATVVLMDYLLPQDVIRTVARERITGLGAVPTLWNQLAVRDWPSEAVASLRYLTSSGGVMPVDTTRRLRERLPDTEIYLMYGLTEAFRSTYLDPTDVDERPDSVGHAVPNAEIAVVRPDGTPCEPGEAGELVHRGALVALGYWRNAEATARRFRPWPQPALTGAATPETAVWSGDRTVRDADGYLYFVGRDDDMIKTSGYRVSPLEVEEIAMRVPGVEQAVAFGAPDNLFGQRIVLVVEAPGGQVATADILGRCRIDLPTFMTPHSIHIVRQLPRTANGKIDRVTVKAEYIQTPTETQETPAT